MPLQLIVRALTELAAIGDVDVVIVARGGGSLADLLCFCDESLCRTVALLAVPVIASVGHHTDRTLLDDVAAVSCSTPTHAAEAAVALDCAQARTKLVTSASRMREQGRHAVLVRAKTLTTLSRAPAAHIERQRALLHQRLREVRAGSRRRLQTESELTARRAIVLERKSSSTIRDCRTRRPQELQRLALALAGHDPQRALERGYALVQTRDGEPIATAAAARTARKISCVSPTTRSRRRSSSHERLPIHIRVQIYCGAPARTGVRVTHREQPQTYETASARVEEIIRRLDSGEASLNETLKLVGEGKALIELCAQELEAVSGALKELRLDELVARLERERPDSSPAGHDGLGGPSSPSERQNRRFGRGDLMSTWDLLAELPVVVEGYELEGHEVAMSSEFVRKTTVIRLHGAGEEGLGEDVTYAAEDQEALQRAGAGRWLADLRSVAGSWTLRSFAERVRSLDLFPQPTDRPEFRLYRNWAFDSAALDLALRQAGTTLHAALGRSL